MTNKGLVCAARCCALKKDLIGDTYSVTLNLRVTGGDGNTIASGTNLSFNNMSDAGYREFCRILGIDEITEDTPFIVQVLCPNAKEDQAFVQMSLAEGDKKLDAKQKKIAEPPKEPKLEDPSEVPALVPLEVAKAALEADPKAMKDERLGNMLKTFGEMKEGKEKVAAVMVDTLKKKSAEITAAKPNGSKALEEIEKARKEREAKSAEGVELKNEVELLLEEAEKLGIKQAGKMNLTQLRKAIEKKKEANDGKGK